MNRKLIMEMELQQDALARVGNYPVVRDSWNKFSEVYQRGKDGSRILRFCGGVAESSASIALKMSQPVLEKLPMATMNDYAVQTLNDMEKKYPVITRSSEEMVDSVKGYSLEKVDVVKTYGTDKFNRLAEVTKLTSILELADTTVDKLLPSTEEEPLPAAEPMTECPEKASQKIVSLSNKVRQRAYSSAMNKIGSIQKRSVDAVQRLRHTVDLIDYSKSLKSTGYDAKNKLCEIYEQVVREESEDESAVVPYSDNMAENIEKKAIFAARRLALRTRRTFRTVNAVAYALPQNAKERVYEAINYAESLLESLAKVDSFSDFTDSLLAQFREKLSDLESVAGDIAVFLMESPPLKWMVIDFRVGSLGYIESPQYTYGWSSYDNMGNGYRIRN